MDIYCPLCKEPWELDSLHEETDYRYPEYKPWMKAEVPEDRQWAKPRENGLYHHQNIYEEYFNKVKNEFYRNGCIAMTAYGGHHNGLKMLSSMDYWRIDDEIYKGITKLIGEGREEVLV